MATCQYDGQLVPKELVVSDDIPAKQFDLDTLEEDECTFNRPITHSLSELIESSLSRHEDSNGEMTMWGNYETNRIVAYYQNGSLCVLSFRLDVASLSKEMVRILLALCNLLDCVVIAEDDIVVEATEEALLASIASSSAARFVANPRAYLDSLIPGQFDS